MNDRPISLVIYLLTYFNTERELFGSRRRFDTSMIWCKHGFQRLRSNLDEKFVRFKVEHKNLVIISE